MITVDLRIKATSEEDAAAAVVFLQDIFGGAVRLRKPRAGTNPKYADRQAWMSYGTLDLPEGGATLVAARKPTTKKGSTPKVAAKPRQQALPAPAAPTRRAKRLRGS
jgi:hypothetical protein